MKILVTGGAGFIGGHLVERLIKEGHKVVVIDDLSHGKLSNLPKSSNLSDYNLDILDETIGSLFKGVDIVYHLAALTKPRWAILEPLQTHYVNVDGTLAILKSASVNKVKRFIFASTSDLYGEQPNYPTSEQNPSNFMNPYALSKLIGEQYCKLFGDLYDLKFNVCRFFNVYGTRMTEDGEYTSVISTFINKVRNHDSLTMIGDGTPKRDFIYVDDVIDQLVLMGQSDIYNETFNCGYGQNVSINELLDKICKIIDKKVSVYYTKPIREPSQTLADISKAKKLLNWKPKISLDEGLRRLIENSN